MASMKGYSRLVKVVEKAGGQVQLRAKGRAMVVGPNGRAYIGTSVGTTEAWKHTMLVISRYTGLRVR